MTPAEQVANSLASLSVALAWGAIVLAVIFALSALGYGIFLRRWIKQEARDGAADYLRSAEGQAALRKIAAAEIASTSVSSSLILPSRSGN